MCEDYISQLSMPHTLPLQNAKTVDNMPANFSDCSTILPVQDPMTGKMVGQMAYYHCLAATGQVGSLTQPINR